MKTVTFTKAFTIEEDERTTTTYPEGWTGEVEDDIAELAAEDGAIERKSKPKTAKPAKGDAAPAADADTPPA